MSGIMLFIPMYQCEHQIARTLRSLVPVQQHFNEILIVDNCSADGSVARASEAASTLTKTRVTLVRNDRNYHFGGSHKIAFDYALAHGFDHMAILHGDDQADINDLIPLLQAEAHCRVDMLLGSRFHPAARRIGYSWFRTLGNQIINRIASVVVRHAIDDTGAGLSVYARCAFADQAYQHFPDDLTFNAYHLFYGLRTRRRVVFFPVTWREQDQISNARVMRQGMQLIAMMLRYILSDHAWCIRTALQPRSYRVVFSASAI